MLWHILQDEKKADDLKVAIGSNWLRGSFSKVLHTVLFLLKNEFILQNTFTGLQCNLHCDLLQRSNALASLVLLSGRLRCWCVWLLGSPHYTPPQCFWSFSPRSGFFNFGNKSKSDGLMSGASDYWGHLITHLLNTSEAFPQGVVLQFWE